MNASSKAISKNGVASANAVSKKGGHAISEAATYNGSGNAIARYWIFFLKYVFYIAISLYKSLKI